MRLGVLIAFLIVPSLATCNEIVIPDKMGGYRVYDTDDGQTTQINSNRMGGYNVYQNGGEVDQVLPNRMGGFNVYQGNSPSDEQPSGSVFGNPFQNSPVHVGANDDE